MRYVLLSTFAILYAQGAVAQEAAPCGGDHSAWLAENAEAMTGTWTDTPIMGLLAGQPMPFGGPEPVQMTAIPNGFTALGEEPVRTYELLLTPDPFTIDPPGGSATLTRLDTEDCAIADLPRLEARYTLTIEGDIAQGTIAAVVVSTSTMHLWFTLETSFGTVEQLSTLTR